MKLISILVLWAALCSGSMAQVQWDVQNGYLCAHEGQTRLLVPAAAGAVDAIVDGVPVLNAKPVVSVKRPVEGRIEVIYTTPNGRLLDIYTRFPKLGEQAWGRQVCYTNTSGSVQRLSGVTMRVCPAITDKPDVWRPKTFWMGRVSPTRFLSVGFTSDEDMYTFQEHKQPAATGPLTRQIVDTGVNAVYTLKPGQSAWAGTQSIWLSGNGHTIQSEYRVQAQRFYRAVGITLVANAPKWLPGAIYYKTTPGGTIESRSSDIGGFANYSRQLDYLADMGLDAIMYHSITQHKFGTDPQTGGWNVYGITDYDTIDIINGGASAFTVLADGTRERGIRVMSELCLNGYYSKQAGFTGTENAHLQRWWTVGHDGKQLKSFGGASMDYSSREWQQAMAKVASRYQSEFGIEGMRLDLGSGSGDNYGSVYTNHHSFSYLGGSLQMLKAISQSAKLGDTASVIMSEDMVHQPERFRYTPLLYGFENKQLLSQQFPSDLSDARTMVKRLTDYYATEYGSLPSGGQVVSTLNGLNEIVALGRASYRYGYGLQRALYGALLGVPGVLQMHQEEESGSYFAYQAMNHARMESPELHTDWADYRSVSFHPEVFTVLRGTKSKALCLSNLSGKAVKGEVHLPCWLRLDGRPVYDMVGRRQVGVVRSHRFSLQMEAYQTMVCRFELPAAVPKVVRYAGQELSVEADSRPFQITCLPDRVAIDSGRLRAQLLMPSGWSQTSEGVYAGAEGQCRLTADKDGWKVSMVLKPGAEAPLLRVFNTDEWLVSGRTALLHDRLIRRHFPWPSATGYHWDRTMTWGALQWGGLYNNVFPTGRLWQSIIEPLHPDKPGLGFVRGDGRLLVDSIQSNAQNIVLTDRTDEAINTPYGLDLRFLSVDRDLSARVARFGFDPWWNTEDSQLGASEQPVKVSFRISAGDVASALSAARQTPINRNSEIERKGEQIVMAENSAVFFVQPGEISWRFPEYAKGRYQVRMLLRRSGLSSDGGDMEPFYTLLVDGKPQPISWGQKNISRQGNAYFGYGTTPVVDLGDGKEHTLTLRMSSTWQAVQPYLTLIKPAE
ncbi:MAG: alpha-amylase family glycosyl hydrolase [Armatimonadota bacterium]